MLRDHDGGGGGHELVGVGWVCHARRHLALGEHGHRHEVDVGLALGHHAAAVGRVRLQVAAQRQVLVSGAPARAARTFSCIKLTIGSMEENN